MARTIGITEPSSLEDDDPLRIFGVPGPSSLDDDDSDRFLFIALGASDLLWLGVNL